MKIINSKHFVPLLYRLFRTDAINLLGYVWVRDGYVLKEHEERHEAIHTAQMKELFYVFFYLLYAIEFVVRFIRSRSRKKAYLTISFEREAYDKQFDRNYLNNRK